MAARGRKPSSSSPPAESSPPKTTKESTSTNSTPKKRTAIPANDSDQPVKKRGRGRPSNAAKAAEALEKAEREKAKDAESEENVFKDSTMGNTTDDTMANTTDNVTNNVMDNATDTTTNNTTDHTKVDDTPREVNVPSSVLEKGVIYFFFRSRVNTNEPQGINDIARSYIVLRPIDTNAKLNEATLEDDGKARLLALPKKQLPKSKQDRFLIFVEKKGETVKDLRVSFASNDYATKTVGTSHSPAATPFAEGVYAITSAANASHLAYHITVPKEIGEVQKELGIYEKGSFTLSAKNPEAPGPANATIDNPAKYPPELQNKFRGLRWMPLILELLDYEGTQVLIIGEGFGDLGNAVEGSEKDKKDESTETPAEELEKLEEEDHDRVEGLEESDPVFADLALSHKNYNHLQTTW